MVNDGNSIFSQKMQFVKTRRFRKGLTRGHCECRIDQFIVSSFYVQGAWFYALLKVDFSVLQNEQR